MNSWSLFLEACTEMLYIVPYINNWDTNDPQPAGSLTMKRISVWLQDGKFPLEINDHFCCIDTDNISGFPDIKPFLQQQYDGVLTNTEFMKNLPVES